MTCCSTKSLLPACQGNVYFIMAAGNLGNESGFLVVARGVLGGESYCRGTDAISVIEWTGEAGGGRAQVPPTGRGVSTPSQSVLSYSK